MSIKIVTDSTSDIPLQLQKELDITVIPLYINLNGQSYQDTVDLTRTGGCRKNCVNGLS